MDLNEPTEKAGVMGEKERRTLDGPQCVVFGGGCGQGLQEAEGGSVHQTGWKAVKLSVDAAGSRSLCATLCWHE